MTPESRILQDRRRFLGSTLGVAAGALWFASCGSEVSESVTMLPDGMDPKNFIVHGPMTIESKRSVLRDEITPTDRIFVRGNLGFPDKSILADAKHQRLEREYGPGEAGAVLEDARYEPNEQSL